MNLDGLKIFGLNIKDYFLDILLLFVWGLVSNVFVYWLYFSNLHKWWPWIDLSPLTFDAVKITVCAG